MADEGKNQSGNRGAGFRLGLLLGIIAGAIIARLLSSDAGADRQPRSPEVYGEPETPIATLRAALEGIRARVIDASREAEEAAREVEQRLSSRYEELTRE
jgi:hypothetical protein